MNTITFTNVLLVSQPFLWIGGFGLLVLYYVNKHIKVSNKMLIQLIGIWSLALLLWLVTSPILRPTATNLPDKTYTNSLIRESKSKTTCFRCT